jgi:hypothetical protein
MMNKNEQSELSREEEMVMRMAERLKEAGEFPDKETDPIRWTQEMNMLRAQAREALMYDSMY